MSRLMLPRCVISGGQTGVDRAALDAATICGIETGGTAARNFATERGPDPSLAWLGLQAKGTYVERNRANVLNSDATLLIAVFALSSGSALTWGLARKHGRPIVAVDPESTLAREQITRFVREHAAGKVLNIAGNRETVAPGIYRRTKELLIGCFEDLAACC